MKHFLYGFHPIVSLLSSPEKIETIYLQKGRNDQRAKDVIALAEKQNVMIKKTALAELNEMTQSTNHQGIVAELRGISHLSESDLPTLLEALTHPALILILDGVQDPHNLGACMRSANAASVDMIITPKDKAVGLTPVVRKVASGAAEITPFVQVTNLARTIRYLKEQGVWVYGTSDQAEQSLYDMKLSGPIAWVLGSEGTGMRRLTQDLCDELVKIPMKGTVNSLNVSVATGVVLFETIRQQTPR